VAAASATIATTITTASVKGQRELLESGESVVYVAERLDDTVETVTETYAHVTPRMRSRAPERLAALLRAATRCDQFVIRGSRRRGRNRTAHIVLARGDCPRRRDRPRRTRPALVQVEEEAEFRVGPC
jgi:hypothetical protein